MTVPMQPQDVTNVLRALPGVSSKERLHFEFKWRCDLIFAVADNALTITLEIGEGDNVETEVMQPVPLQYFGTPENLNAFLTELKRNFLAGLRPTLTHEAVLFLYDVRAFLFSIMELDGSNRDDAIKRHTDATSARLTQLFARLPERQRSTVWTKIALKNAVQTAALCLLERGINGRALNLDAVNTELLAQYGNQAPQSGEALRKQLDERKLSWRQLKTEVQRYAQLRSEDGMSSSEKRR
jgi:hypothetical protein